MGEFGTKNVLIAGAGAIGIAIGATLSAQGFGVIFYARGATKEAILAKGVMRTGLFGEIEIAAGKIAAVDTLDGLQKAFFDYVLVCSKTLANEEISEVLYTHRDILKTDGKIVIMQNGWGNDIPYLRYFSKEQLYQARVITGFQRVEPNVSRVTVHTAPILFGSLYGYDSSCMEPLAEAICETGLPSEVTEELREALWAKMLYNTTLNPLGAILNVPYGLLADSIYGRQIMDRLIEETFTVMEACGHTTFWKSPEEYREVFYGKLVPDTYGHRSSTLQDIEKKQKTEIATLNGCIVRLAQEKGIEVPTHRLICELILAMEEQF